MRVAARRHSTDDGFTLLELMIAAVVMAIIFMGLLSSITGAFLATDMANMATEAQATARRLLEEATELDYGDMLLLDGNSLFTPDGLAAKCRVFETSPGLLTLEVEVCRPGIEISLPELAAMTMEEFGQVEAVRGSRIRFTTLSTGTIERAEVTDVTEAAGGPEEAVPDDGGGDDGSVDDGSVDDGGDDGGSGDTGRGRRRWPW